MPGPQPRRHSALGRRAASVPRFRRARSKALGKTVSSARHDRALIERELAELDEECARVRRLLQRLSAARRARKDAGAILGELGTSVLHLHVHTKGLDEMLDALE